MAIIGEALLRPLLDRIAMQALMIAGNEAACNYDGTAINYAPWGRDSVAVGCGAMYDFMHDTLGVGSGDAEIEADLAEALSTVDTTDKTSAFLVSKFQGAIGAMVEHCTSREFASGHSLAGSIPESFAAFLATCVSGGLTVHYWAALAISGSGTQLQARNVFIDSDVHLLLVSGRTLQDWVAGAAGFEFASGDSPVLAYRDLEYFNDETGAGLIFQRSGNDVGMGRYYHDGSENFEYGLALMTADSETPGQQDWQAYDDSVADAGASALTHRTEYAPCILYGVLDGLASSPLASDWTIDVTVMNPDGTTAVKTLTFSAGDTAGTRRQIDTTGDGKYIAVTVAVTNGSSVYSPASGDIFHIEASPIRDINL